MNATACAPATPVAGGPLQIVVSSSSDFTIQLTPHANPLVEKPANAPKRMRLVHFRVSRAILQQHSSFFQTILRTRPDLAIVNFENKGNGFGYALEIWLRALHNGAESLPNNLKATHSERAWVAIGVGEQFGFAPQHIDKLKPWFLECYQHALNNGTGLTPMTACCLAFPCSVFDHAEGFMKLTKYLAYHTNGNMFSHNNSSFQMLNQDARILDGPLTTARAHIQSILDKELNFPLDKLHRATCPCRKETAFDYQEALIALDCWPIDQAVQKYPLAEIIDELSKFEFAPIATNCESGACTHDFKNSVNIAIRKAKFAFDGLCLDCMERSQASEVNEVDSRDALIKKNSPYKGCWDIDCRYGHGRASWYYSWMGSASVRRDIVNQHREEKRAAGYTSRGRRGGKNAKRPNKYVVPNSVDHLAAVKNEKNAVKYHRYDDDDSIIKQEFDVEDDDVFFDAEDNSIDEHVATK